MPVNKFVVMISSSSLDLPEYREMANDTCDRSGWDVSKMKRLTADSEPPVAVSIRGWFGWGKK